MSAGPMNPRLNPFGFAFDIHLDVIDDLAENLLPVGVGRRLSVPQCRNIGRQPFDSRLVLVGQRLRLRLTIARVLFFKLSLESKFFFPGRFQTACDEAVFRLDRMELACGSLRFLSRSLESLLPESLFRLALPLDIIGHLAAD